MLAAFVAPMAVGDPPGLVGEPVSLSSLKGRPAGSSGTVGVLTGTTGVRMGMGPMPPDGRRKLGLEEGVRRMVATPGVRMTGPALDGSPAVEAGRFAWNMRR